MTMNFFLVFHFEEGATNNNIYFRTRDTRLWQEEELCRGGISLPFSAKEQKKGVKKKANLWNLSANTSVEYEIFFIHSRKEKKSWGFPGKMFIWKDFVCGGADTRSLLKNSNLRHCHMLMWDSVVNNVAEGIRLFAMEIKRYQREIIVVEVGGGGDLWCELTKSSLKAWAI